MFLSKGLGLSCFGGRSVIADGLGNGPAACLKGRITDCFQQDCALVAGAPGADSGGERYRGVFARLVRYCRGRARYRQLCGILKRYGDPPLRVWEHCMTLRGIDALLRDHDVRSLGFYQLFAE